MFSIDSQALIQPNETPKAYRIRLYKNKDLYGLNNIEIGKLCNEAFGVEWDESAHRKKTQNYLKGYNDAKAELGNSDQQLQNMIDENKKLIQELAKQEVKIRDERNELRRVIREEARKESYKEQIMRSISEYHCNPLSYDENKQFTGILKTDNDLIISCTDIHAGIEIDNYFNKFNEDVLRSRFNQYLDKIFEVQIRHGSENAYVILSELVSGIIHNELRIENNQNLIEQFLSVTNYISQFLAELSYHFNAVNVYICPGNHSRVMARKEESLKGENIDHLAIPFLQAKLQNFKNINFNTNDIEESIAMFNVRNNVVMSSHGDKDSPSNVVQKFTLLFGIRPSLVYLGHRHTNGLTTVYNTKVIESGTLSGTDNYALDLRLHSKPSQTISVVTENGLDCLYDVKFD